MEKVEVAVVVTSSDPPLIVMPEVAVRLGTINPPRSVEVAMEVPWIEPPVKVMPFEEENPPEEMPPVKVEVAEVAVEEKRPVVFISLEELMVMSSGMESSFRPEMAPVIVGLLTIIFGGRELMRLVALIIF